MGPVLRAALCALLIGCASGKLPPREAAAGASRVRDVVMYVSWFNWEKSPWFRVYDNDGMLPVHLVIADDGRGCIVDGYTWASAIAGEYFSCGEAWRFPR